MERISEKIGKRSWQYGGAAFRSWNLKNKKHASKNVKFQLHINKDTHSDSSKNFSRNKIFLIGILVIGIVLICGWLVWNSQIEPNLISQVIITTDKTEYEQGEMLKVTVRNNQTKSIWFMEQGCNHQWWEIEKQENENWKPESLMLPYIIDSKETCRNCIASPLNFELKPKSEISYEWNLRYCKNSNPALFEPGHYRLCFYAKPTKDVYGGKIIYSNEFTIKEKSALDPRCSEKVKGDNGCGAQWFGYEFDQSKGICVMKVVVGCSYKTPFNSLEECQKVCENKIICRDENYGCTIDDIPCCSGLKEIPLAYENKKGKCVTSVPCGSICVSCGDGICEDTRIENKCNCPEDCK